MGYGCADEKGVSSGQDKSGKLRTIFGDVSDGRVEIGGAEDVADNARDGDGEVVDPNATFARRRSVERRTLEVRVRLLVELRLVLDPRRDRLVRVERSELEIGDVSLEEVAEVVRDAETCRRGKLSMRGDQRERKKDEPFEHRILIVTLDAVSRCITLAISALSVLPSRTGSKRG